MLVLIPQWHYSYYARCAIERRFYCERNKLNKQRGSRESNFLFCKTAIKSGLLTLVNQINKLQEIVEGSEETSARFKSGNYNKIFFIKNPDENSNKR